MLNGGLAVLFLRSAPLNGETTMVILKYMQKSQGFYTCIWRYSTYPPNFLSLSKKPELYMTGCFTL